MSSVKSNLHVLIVEDSENDANLLEIELQRAGFNPVCQRVETGRALESALTRQLWDVVIADYVMPQFNGLEALAMVRNKGLDIPFIIVSGHITDDTAVAAMKAGAHDYVMKDNLKRLGSAVHRELREADVRREQRRAEETLQAESAFRKAIENSVPSGISVVDLEGRQTYVNPAFCAMVGWPESELVGARPPFIYWCREERDAITEALGKVSQGEAPAGGIELRFCRRNGERIDVLLQVTPLRDSFGNVTGWVSSASDITQRKRAEVRLAAEHAITRILSNAPSLDEACPGILQVLLDSLEMDFGAFWTMDGRHETLQPSLMNLRKSSPGLKQYLEETRRQSLTAGSDTLPSRVWKERRPVWISDVLLEDKFQNREWAAKAGLRSAVAVPIHHGNDFFGALEFFTTRRLEPDPALMNMMTAIGSEIGQFVRRRTAEEDLRRAHDELEMRVQQRTADLKTANSKLHTAIVERKRLEHELLDITEKERRRIGLDLHDDLGQKLSGVALMIKGLEVRLAKKNNDEAKEASKIHVLVQQAMSHASDLAHDLATLNPKDKDLPGALNDLADHAREVFAISCSFNAHGPIPALEANTVGQMYKIAQEALTNAIKHGKARNVSISLGNGSENVVMVIENDGKPFPAMKSRSTGMGLRIMNYRASLIGASLEIDSAGESGTLVKCSLPVDAKK